MGNRFTSTHRERIVRDYERRHGNWDARGFYDEVKATGPSHECWEWFNWDDAACGELYRVNQAREFGRLDIEFEVQEVGGASFNVEVVSGPLAFSPLDSRQRGGGYVVTDPNNPAHVAELTRQAVTDLERWARRYAIALNATGTQRDVDKLITKMKRGGFSIAAE